MTSQMLLINFHFLCMQMTLLYMVGTYDTFQNTDNTDIILFTITHTINKELLLIVT